MVVLLRREGFTLSASTVGRVLAHLRRQGQLIEPRQRAVSAHKRRLAPRRDREGRAAVRWRGDVKRAYAGADNPIARRKRR